MNTHARPEATHGFIGPRPFELADSHLFFGRTREISRIEMMARSVRVSLLHAPSGAGKTSMLEASLMPWFEEQGTFCVRSRPFGAPRQSLIEDTALRILPRPEDEARGIRRAMEAVDCPLDARLTDLRRMLNGLDRNDPRFIAARAPLSMSRDGTRGSILATPISVRTLAMSGRPLLFASYLTALGRLALRSVDTSGVGADGSVRSVGSAPLGAILEFLDAPDVAEAGADALRNLVAGAPALDIFFDRLFGRLGRFFDDLSVVLFLDQFEEFFTMSPLRYDGRQGKPTTGGRISEEMRDAFFAELAAVLRPARRSDQLPLRAMISMRDDFIAEIDTLERFVGPIARDARYHLTMLDEAQALLAIERPASLMGEEVNRESSTALVRQLSQGRGEIQPAHLQIVCEEIVHAQGGLFAAPVADDTVELTLSSYFDRILREISEERLDPFAYRAEALHLLRMLRNDSGTRQLRDPDELVFHDRRHPAMRRRLLDELESRRLIRTETRYESKIVEITHEVLLPLVAERIVPDSDTGRYLDELGAALQKLGEIERLGYWRWNLPLLRESEYEALRRYHRLATEEFGDEPTLENRTDPQTAAARKLWFWLPRYMMRAALRHDRGEAELHYWAGKTRIADALDRPDPAARWEQLQDENAPFDLRDLDLLFDRTPEAKVTRARARMVLRSAVLHREPAVIDRAMAWLKDREAQHGSG